MFVLRPSSPIRPYRVAHEPVTGAVPATAAATTAKTRGKKGARKQPKTDAEPYLDPGLPIPDSYDVDIIRALLQDPFRVFLYWVVRPGSLAALTRVFSAAEVAEFKTVLKLRELGGGTEAYFDVGERGRYWMLVFPDREYEFELGVRSPSHGFIMLVRSNRVRTPRGTVSAEPAPSPEYHLDPADFVNVIEASGFSADQALNLTFTPVDPAIDGEAQLEAAVGRLSPPVLEAVRAAASGEELTVSMIDQLPEPLRSELLKLLATGSGRIASLGLTHYLPEILREAIEDERELIGDHIHPLHLSPRYFVGASENAEVPAGDVRLPGVPRRPSSDARYQKPEGESGSGLRRLLARV